MFSNGWIDADSTFAISFFFAIIVYFRLSQILRQLKKSFEFLYEIRNRVQS